VQTLRRAKGTVRVMLDLDFARVWAIEKRLPTAR
jgi:hypothetical protein